MVLDSSWTTPTGVKETDATGLVTLREQLLTVLTDSENAARLQRAKSELPFCGLSQTASFSTRSEFFHVPMVKPRPRSRTSTSSVMSYGSLGTKPVQYMHLPYARTLLKIVCVSANTLVARKFKPSQKWCPLHNHYITKLIRPSHFFSRMHWKSGEGLVQG